MNFRDYCKGGLEEINNIYEKANQLEFEEEPNYDLYINILKESIKKRNIKKKDNNFFCWEEKMKKIIVPKKIEKLIEENKELRLLFKGYPINYIINFINKNYTNN